MKRIRGYLLCLCFFVVCPGLTDASENVEVYKDEALRIWLTGIQTHDKIVEIRYRVENISDRTIWICSESDFTEEYHSSESFIEKDAGTLFLRMNSPVVPKDVLFDIPPVPIFSKILPGRVRELVVKIRFPAEEYRYFEQYESQSLRFQECKQIQIELGYYNENDLSPLREESSYKKSLAADDDVYIDCFWIGENPSTIVLLTLDTSSIEWTEASNTHFQIILGAVVTFILITTILFLLKLKSTRRRKHE